MSKNKPPKDVTLFEDLSKEVVVKNNLKVPMSMVFGHGTGGNLPSFGGKNLAENALAVDLALENTNEMSNIWNRSHTQWMWRHLNLSWHAPLRNMRQIASDIASRKAALNDAKWRHIETELKIRKIEDELQNSETLSHWREVELKIKLAKFKEGWVEGKVYIEGAMKDILALNELYEQLKETVSNFTEEELEQEESKTHLRRSLVQSIRDVRQMGSISKGEQEYLEQIGVNPMKVQKAMRVYVQSEEQSENWHVGELHQFVDHLTNELIDNYKVDQIKMHIQGFKPDAIKELTHTTPIAKIHKKDSND